MYYNRFIDPYKILVNYKINHKNYFLYIVINRSKPSE